ncbi:uncharacterized protein O8D03_000717 [Erethizon dorsatum]
MKFGSPLPPKLSQAPFPRPGPPAGSSVAVCCSRVQRGSPPLEGRSLQRPKELGLIRDSVEAQTSCAQGPGCSPAHDPAVRPARPQPRAPHPCSSRVGAGPLPELLCGGRDAAAAHRAGSRGQATAFPAEDARPARRTEGGGLATLAWLLPHLRGRGEERRDPRQTARELWVPRRGDALQKAPTRLGERLRARFPGDGAVWEVEAVDETPPAPHVCPCVGSVQELERTPPHRGLLPASSSSCSSCALPTPAAGGAANGPIPPSEPSSESLLQPAGRPSPGFLQPGFAVHGPRPEECAGVPAGALPGEGRAGCLL